MKNPHIIVGAGHRCLCGTYGIPGGTPDKAYPLGCSSVLDALDRITGDGASILKAVIVPLVEDRPMPMDDNIVLAGHLYEQYCQAVGGFAFNGDPLPNWETFRGDPTKQKQSDACVAVASCASNRLLAAQ
jgi:hypothetical protein